MQFIKSVAIFILTIFLSACGKEVTYSYLMQHSEFLQNENLRCSVLEYKTPDDITYCKMVEKATTDFMAMVNIQQEQPERFGQLVMRTEFEVMKARQEVQNAKKAVKIAKARIDEVALTTANKQLADAKKNYQDKYEEWMVLFSVLRLHSPE